MTQELVIRQTKTVRKFSEKKWVSKAILVILLFTTACFSANAQNNAVSLSNTVKIIKVDVTNESARGLIDGKISVSINDNNTRNSRYRVSYDFLSEGNNFVSEELTSVNNILTLNNAKIGPYYNLRVIRTADNLKSAVANAFSLKNSEIRNVAGFQETPPTNVTCSGTLSYVNCAGANKSISNAISGSAYCDENSYRPCGFEVTSNCTIAGINRWHCFDGNLSVPPNNNRYDITDYAGAGLTALQACRINWVVCNYAYNASGVDVAIWYIAGTGGSNNSIAQAAASAVPVANGTQYNMVFYNSVNSNYQSMVKYTCATASCTGRVTSLYFNELNGGTDLPITNGSTFTVSQLSSLYDLEVGTSGTIGSIKYTITGPTPSSNIENTIPYNSPGTGAGPWTGATGTYSVNLKTYSGADATGTLCHDTTITFNLVQTPPCTVGGINLGNLTDYLFVFTNGSTDANWQSASKGYIGNVAVDGNQATVRTSGSFAYAGTIYTNSSSLGNWQSIITNNSGQAFSSLNQSSTISGLETDLSNAFAQINALTVTPGYSGVSSTSLNGLNTTDGLAKTYVINITSGFQVSSKINITGDPGDIFILRWDTDANFNNGYNGQVKFQSGGAIVPLGGLKPSNFINVAGDINASGGGSNPTAPYPQGPRTNNGTGSLITGGSDFSGGGFFTGYWLTTGDPSNGQTTTPESNAIFVGGWYSSTTKFSMTSGTSGVYVAPVCGPALGSIGDKVWFDANGNGIQDASETIGLSGITVKLRNSSNAVIATTTTDGSGNYLFSNIAAGTYTVEFPTSTASYILSPAYVGSNRDIDSDPSTSTGLTPTITLSAGQNIVNIDAGYAADCSCTNSSSNLLVNGSFENGTTGWILSGGNLTTGTGYVMCGANNGFLNWSSGTAKMYQDINVVAGSTVNFSGYSGTHTPGISCSPTLSLIYLNSSNAVISQTNVNVTKNVDLTGANLDLYTITGVAPTGTVKVRVQASIGCNTLKADAFCLTVIAPPARTNPDFNSTFVNVAVPGNVSINDNVPAGTTYGTSPTLVSSPAGSSPAITMNADGTYSFVSNKAGVYTYDVPVCVPGQSAPCPPTKLVITVLDATVNTNPPVANVDIATTKINTAVTLKTLVNDAAANANSALVSSTVTVTVAPLHGTTSVNAATGDITFTPTTGYTGTDTLTYQVCDNQSPAKCATAKQIITIISSTAANTTSAADDYKITDINTAATGNVKTNDNDPEGNTQTVTAQTTTVAGKGTLVLATDGNYTFTPVTGYVGPVDFPYTTCDNGTPQACAMATLHILVRPVVPATNPDFNSTYVNVPVPGNVSTNDKVPAGTTYGTSPTLLSSPAGSSPSITMNSNGTYSFVSNLPGVYTYDVPVCVPGQSAPCPPTKLVITVLDATVNTNPPVANVDIATTKINTAVTLKTLANDAAGNLNSSLVPSTVTVTVAPLHGTTSINVATGDITFTPSTGYTGTDTLTYQVCDNQSPAKCATAKQIITILPSTAVNTTTAADDYNIVSINMNGTGNVKTNDVDPEGNTQTVTAQNTTITSKGTLILATDGNYTFVPVTGFTGPVDFPYTTCDNGTPQACATATLHILVRPEVPSTNPDFNSTYVNVPVPGNVNTNDKVPAGTTYGTSPTLLSSPAGSSPVLTMNANGTYSFVSNVPGVYTYDVPVCVPNQIIPCPPTKLVITVLNANVNTNPPVANVDIATTNVNIPVTLKTLANDAAANATSSLVASTVTVTVAPLHGTTSVNPATGDITYTPASGYTGTDTLTYQVCDNQSPSKCATAKQIITIKSPSAANTTAAADDYRITDINTPASGNVKTNDTDPENNTQTVAAQTTTVAGKGTLVLASDGNYTFTPVTGYTGPVDFPYTTCDNGIPQACASATLHILVRPVVPATNPDFNSTLVNVPVPGNVSTNDKVPAGTTYGTSPTLLSSPAGSSPSITMNPDGTYSFVSNVKGVYVYDVPVCVPGQTAPCPPTKLTITVLDGTINSNAPVANVDIAATKVNVPVTLKTLSNDAAGNTANSLVPSSVTVTVAPLHGTTSVNAVTGDITYTPASGYTGTDTLTYQVCDDQSPSKCATANQIITIKPATAPNTTEAADDYKITPINTPANGNVKTNDTDAEGNTQTVTAQNTTIAGKGTLVLGTDGNYTFTPVAGFTGPVDYPYTTCDNGVPQACAAATLHILVKPLPQLPDLTPSIFNDGTTLVQNTTRDNVIRIFNIGTGATSGTIIFTIPKMLPAYQITINPNETFMDVFGGFPVANSDWTIVEEATRYVFTSKPGVVIPGGGGSKDVGVKVKAIGIKSSTANLSVRIVFGTGGGETPFNNNADNNTYSTN